MRRETSLQAMINVLEPGGVYRRADFDPLSSNVDRNLAQLVKENVLEKICRGIYLHPHQTTFGQAMPEEKKLLRKFLDDDNFVVYSPCMFNSLGFGTTQLYDKVIVLNKKRHGKIAIGGRTFFFHRQRNVPRTMTKEFLMVEMLNRFNELAEDKSMTMNIMQKKLHQFNPRRLKNTASRFGKKSTQARVKKLLRENHSVSP
ncbi:MAG: DUF6088 family protein [Pseudomonadota bacterium]|nr:DUF6088 family protein [Pseudomonadota bacterium]